MATLGQYDNSYLKDLLSSEPGSEYKTKKSLGDIEQTDNIGDFVYSPERAAKYSSESTLGSDLRKTFLAGTVGLGGAVIEAGRQANLIPEDVATREQLKGAESQKRLEESASSKFKEEASKQLFDDEGNFTGEFSATTLAHRLTASAPDIIATIVPVGGAMKLAKAAGLAKKYLGVTGVAAASASEGLVAGAENANQSRQQALSTPIEVYRKNPLFLEEVNKLDPNVPVDLREERAREILADRAANDVFVNTTLSTGLIGAATGGGVIGSIITRNAGRVTSSLIKGGGKEYLKAIGTDIAKEGFQELGQSGAEQYIQNQATKDYVDPETNVYKGVINAAAEGAVTGAAMGGGLGVLHNAPTLVNGKVEEDKGDTFSGTNQEIKTSAVKTAYNKYSDTFNKVKNVEDPAYQEVYKATVDSLNSIINPGEGKTADPIASQEAKQALDEIQAVHASRIRTDQRLKEAEKAKEEIVKAGQEATPETPETPVAPIAPEVSQGTPIAPEVPQGTPIAPEVSQETPIAPEVSQETPIAPEVSQGTPIAPEVTQETPIAPEVTQEPSFNTLRGSIEGNLSTLSDPNIRNPLVQLRDQLSSGNVSTISNSAKNALEWIGFSESDPVANHKKFSSLFTDKTLQASLLSDLNKLLIPSPVDSVKESVALTAPESPVAPETPRDKASKAPKNTKRPESPKESNLQKDQEITFDGTALNDRPIPPILRNKFTPEQLKSLKAQVISPPKGEGNAVDVLIEYPLANGDKGSVRTKIHKDSINTSQTIEQNTNRADQATTPETEDSNEKVWEFLGGRPPKETFDSASKIIDAARSIKEINPKIAILWIKGVKSHIEKGSELPNLEGITRVAEGILRRNNLAKESFSNTPVEPELLDKNHWNDFVNKGRKRKVELPDSPVIDEAINLYNEIEKRLASVGVNNSIRKDLIPEQLQEGKDAQTSLSVVIGGLTSKRDKDKFLERIHKEFLPEARQFIEKWDTQRATSQQSNQVSNISAISDISPSEDLSVKAEKLNESLSEEVSVDEEGKVEPSKEIVSTENLEVNEDLTPSLSPQQEELIKQLDYELSLIEEDIKEAKSLGESTKDLLQEKKDLIEKLASLRSDVPPKRKKVSKKSKTLTTKIDEDGQRYSIAPDATLNPSRPVAVNHSANKQAFDKIKNSLRKLNFFNGLTFEYIEDFSTHDWSKTPIKPSQDLFFANGLQRAEGSKTFIYINGARFGSYVNDLASTNKAIRDMAGTIFHELVGHYGVRKLFDRTDGTNQYDTFLKGMLNSELKADIFSNALPWQMYLNNWKHRNVKGYSALVKSKDFEGAKRLYEAHLKDLPANQKLKIKELENRKVVEKDFPMEIALRYADEYVAELAKEKILDDSFVEKTVGFGSTQSLLRDKRRNVREKFITSLFAKIKHLLKSIFGENFNFLKKEDVLAAIAESYDRIFENINPIAQLETNRVYADEYINPVRSEDSTLSQIGDPLVAFSVPPQQNNFSPFRLINNEDQFANIYLSQFGDQSDNIRRRTFNKLDQAFRNNAVTRVFTTFGNMQDIKLYSSLQAIAKGHISKVEASTLKMASAMKGLSSLQNQLVFEYFTTKQADPDMLPISNVIQKNAIIEAKQSIREMGRFLAESGIISKESYEKNEDQYLHVQYLQYINQYRGSGKKASVLSFAKWKKPRNDMEALALGQIKDVKFLVPETYGVMARDLVIIEMLNTINRMSAKNKLHWVLTGTAQVNHEGKRMSLDDAHEQLNQNLFIINEMLKQDRTNYFNANQTTFEAFQESTNQLAEKIGKIEDSFIDEAFEHAKATGQSTAISKDNFLRDHYVRLPVKKQLGKLSNKYVRKEIANDLETFTNNWDTSHKGNIEKFFAPNGTLERVHRFWKQMMVVYNPGSWVRNFFGNFSLLDLSTSTNSVKLTGMLYNEITNKMKNNPSEFWLLADKYGLFGTTLSAVELQDVYSQYKDELEAAQASFHKRQSTSWDDSLRISDERITALLKMFSHRATAKTSEWFALLEGTFKTVAFRDYVERWEKENNRKVNSLTETEREVIYSKAANHANDSIFDYSQVPNFVKTLRRIPLGAPFLTFTYKAAPIAIKSMVQNPIKFMKYAALPALLTTIAMSTNDWDDDDIKRLKSQLPDYYRLNTGTAFLPVKDSAGRPQIIPLDYIIPWSQWTTASRHIYDNFVEDHFESPGTTSLQSVGTLFKQLGFLGGPTPTALAAMLSGQDSFSGRKIITPGASGSQQLGEIMTFAGNMMAPSWLSSHGWAGKMYHTLTDDIPRDKFGDIKYTPFQAAASITGFGTIGVSERAGASNRQQHFDKKVQEVSTYRNKVARDFSLSSQDKASKIKEANERIKLIRLQQREEQSGGSVLDRF